MTVDDQDQEAQVRSGLVDKVRRTLGRVPFAEQALAAYYCSIDPTTPRHVKAILIGALAYFITPVDAIPDLIAGLGFTDDAAVFWAAWRSISNHINDRHVAEAKQLMARLRDS